MKYQNFTYFPHICELTSTERVSPAFQTSYPLQKCCSISPAFIQVNRRKATVQGILKLIYLVSLSAHYLSSSNNLVIAVQYQK